MSEVKGAGTSPKAERTTFQFSQEFEDVVRHVGDMAESIGRYYDARTLLMKKRIELIEAQTKGIEEVKRAQAAQSNVLQIVDKRLKAVEQGQKSWRDEKSKPHHKSSNNRPHHIAVQPTTSEVKKDEGAVTTTKEVTQTREEKFSNTSLKEQVQKLAAGVG